MTSRDSPFTHGRCEICDSPYKILLRNVGTARTKRIIPLFYCMECESMTCIQDYVEDQPALIADVAYNMKYFDTKLIAFARLAKFLHKKLHPGSDEIVTHADIGCNIGVLVKAFSDASFQSVGYDINPIAVEKAHSLFPENEIIAKKAGTDGRQFDVVTLIDVLEHIKAPFEFFNSVLPCLKEGGHLFIVVPRVDRDSWRCLTEDIAKQQKPDAELTPFLDNDVHVVHYSSKGLAKIGERSGLQVVADFNDKPWPLNGILLRKPVPGTRQTMAATQRSAAKAFVGLLKTVYNFFRGR